MMDNLAKANRAVMLGLCFGDRVGLVALAMESHRAIEAMIRL